MNAKLIEDIANAVLYEGYLLYPYRASAIKNRQRWNFGVLYPRAYADRQSGADAWSMRTECLVRTTEDVSPLVRVRFLHLIAQDREGQSWQGAMEREAVLPAVCLSELVSGTVRHSFAFPGGDNQRAIEMLVEREAEHLAKDVVKLRVTIYNNGEFNGAQREDALLQSLVSTHTILALEYGEFVSLLEPPDDLRDSAMRCDNVGTWPVLVGEAGTREAMLSSPVILYDYPQIAPESPGALFDGTEIDEILSLRILTLTDDEKREMGLADDRAREILERTESMAPEQFMKMHGVLRGLRDSREETP
jgi:hydrogenase maturation protease